MTSTMAGWPTGESGEEPGGPHEGVPDGMKIDRQGNLYGLGPGGYGCGIRPDITSELFRARAACQSRLGDAGYSTLYITATTSVYKTSTYAHGFIPYL